MLVWLYGFYAVVDGLLALAALLVGGRQASGRRGWFIFEGVVGIAAGVFAFLWPGITALVLVYLIAAWAVVTGLLEVVAAIILRRELLVGGLAFELLLLPWRLLQDPVRSERHGDTATAAGDQDPPGACRCARVAVG